MARARRLSDKTCFLVRSVSYPLCSPHHFPIASVCFVLSVVYGFSRWNLKRSLSQQAAASFCSRRQAQRQRAGFGQCGACPRVNIRLDVLPFRVCASIPHVDFPPFIPLPLFWTFAVHVDNSTTVIVLIPYLLHAMSISYFAKLLDPDLHSNLKFEQRFES